MVSSLPSLLCLIAGSAILQPTLSQKWKEMEIAQQLIASNLNSTTPELNELISELAPNQSSSLECMIFGNEGCSFICDLKCFMYGCVSAGICNPIEDVCDCRESYRIGNEYVSSSFFRFLPLANLWDYRFEQNAVSTIITNYIKEDMKTTQAVGWMLQDPHITGAQIKHKLLQMFPHANWLLFGLRPIVRGNIDRFLSPERHFIYPRFTYFLNEYIKAKYAEIERMQIRERTGLESYLENPQNIEYMVRQLLLFPSEYMQTVMAAFITMTNNTYEQVINATNVDAYTSQDPGHQLTSQQVDEIVQAGAFSQLLEFESIPGADQDEHTKEPVEHNATLVIV